MANESTLFQRKLPQNPTPEQIAEHTRYMQERLEFMFNRKIAELERRIAELEG